MFRTSSRTSYLVLLMQLHIKEGTCPNGHVVQYDGGADGLFSLRRSNDSGRVLLFTRSFCDSLMLFIHKSQSSYSAATSFLASLRSGYGLRRQLIVLLGRCFVAVHQPTPELFVCPKCGFNPYYNVIDGQALGFRLREDIHLSRPALHLPSMNLKVDDYAVIREPSIRAAIRAVIKTGDKLNKTDAEALSKLHAALMSVRPLSRKAATTENWQIKRQAATLFFRFFEWTSVDDLVGTAPNVPIPAAGDSSVGRLGEAPPVKAAAVPWLARAGTCHSRFDAYVAAGTEWATIRPFILAFLVDPVANLFAGQAHGPLRALAAELQKEDGGRWRQLSTASNAVGFVANFSARVGPLLDKKPALRKAVGAVLLFAVEVGELVDREFQAAAKKGLDDGQTKTQENCKRWLGVTTPEQFNKFAAEHNDFKNVDLDSPFKTTEFFGYLKRVRPAIFAPQAGPRSGKRSQPAGAGRPRKGSQAFLEDPGDRCSKSFPKHSQLMAGVFNIVCPHVVTLGFRVMFQVESVADALSLILERFPELPQVVFYDVARKIDRIGMQRVRSILSRHGVRFCVDRAHAKGDTCSCIQDPDEALAVTHCVSTQAAEVQHSVSVKFRGHLTYMSPASFMAHRIAQLSLMSLTAAFKLTDATAKAENDGVRLNAYNYNVRGDKCVCTGCTCPASAPRPVSPDLVARGGDVESEASNGSVNGGEDDQYAEGRVAQPAGLESSASPNAGNRYEYVGEERSASVHGSDTD